MGFLDTLGTGLGKGIGSAAKGFGDAAKTVAKATADVASASLETAQIEEYRRKIAACDDKTVKVDASMLHELMESDKIPIFNRHMHSPSLYVSYQMRSIMNNYPSGSPEYEKLGECIGETNLGEIKYRMMRFWPDAIRTIVGFVIVILIIAFIIYIFATVSVSSPTGTSVQSTQTVSSFTPKMPPFITTFMKK